jgi:hypothetical protein
MSFQAMGMAAVLLGIVQFLTPQSFGIYVFIVSILLGSAAALVLPSLGNSTILPPHLLLGFLAIRCLASKSRVSTILQSLTFPRAGFWLLLAVLYGVISAIFFPRIFSGITYVFSIARTQIGPAIVMTPLAPTSANITQTVYFVGDLFCFVLFFVYSSNQAFFNTIARALIACAIANLMFAVLDLATFWTGTAQVLDFIRNANYTLLDTAKVGGFKRIVGSFPEASTFGAITLGLFVFCLKLWIGQIYPRLTIVLASCSLLALIFSMSSTAYGGTAVALGVLYVTIVGQVLAGRGTVQAIILMLAFPLVVVVIVTFFVLNGSALIVAKEVIDSTITNKFSSSSAVERGAWSWQALINFVDTRGMGAGVGSVRASSFPAAVLGSIGIFGAVTYTAFLVSLFYGGGVRSSGSSAAIRSAARWACFSDLTAAVVAGGFVDLGLLFFTFAGLASGQVHDTHHSPSTALSPQQNITPPSAIVPLALRAQPGRGN